MLGAPQDVVVVKGLALSLLQRQTQPSTAHQAIPCPCCRTRSYVSSRCTSTNGAFTPSSVIVHLLGSLTPACTSS